MMTNARKNGLDRRRMEILEWNKPDTAGLFWLELGIQDEPR
jgi:hypothetical protein